MRFDLTRYDTFWPHGYPLLLAALYAIGDRPFETVAVFQALLGAALALLGALVAERIGRSRGIALCALAVLGLYPPLVFYGALLLTELPAAFLLTLAAGCLLGTPARAATVLASVSLAAAAIVRPNLLLLYPLIPVFLWSVHRREWRAALARSALFFAVSCALLLPVCLLNSALLQRPAGLATNGGLNFFLARAPYSVARYQGTWGVQTIAPIPNALRHRMMFHSPVPLYDESYFYLRGLAQIEAEPASLLHSLVNVRDGLGLGALDYWPGWPPWKALLRGSSKAYFWLVILPMAVHAATLCRGGRILSAEHAPQLLGAGCLAVLLATFYLFLGDPRVHVPFDPLFIVLSLEALRRAARTLAKVYGRPIQSTGNSGGSRTTSNRVAMNCPCSPARCGL
jgi:hypothetical protein